MDGRQLTIRRWADDQFYGRGFVFRWRLLLSPRRWWRAVTNRYSRKWEFRYSRHLDYNARCYCQVGTYAQLTVSILGFGFTAFYSNYTGPTPCPCDEFMESEEYEATLSGANEQAS